MPLQLFGSRRQKFRQPDKIGLIQQATVEQAAPPELPLSRSADFAAVDHKVIAADFKARHWRSTSASGKQSCSILI